MADAGQPPGLLHFPGAARKGSTSIWRPAHGARATNQGEHSGFWRQLRP